MLSSMFENRRHSKRATADKSTFASSLAHTESPENARPQYDHRPSPNLQGQQPAKDNTSDSEDHGGERDYEDEGGNEDEDDEEAEDDEDEEEAAPLLPLFDATHLNALPIYTLTHTIRLMVSSRCDTVLSWEQLLSPQVSQFLLKPIQQEVRNNHFSAATIYCLMANCLQFTKEVDINPGNSGTIQTRAMICELLAIKLLKEFTTRSLIDALSYDFDPLQGQSDVDLHFSDHTGPNWQSPVRRSQPRSARISCLEIAIRAQAKRFLAHPMVVQHMEAIWNGTIVFHAAADSIHRRRRTSAENTYGTASSSRNSQPRTAVKAHITAGARKVVTLYNPRDASLFKLSRLRVPRYRNILSTCTFAIFLGLFVGVLVQRSLHIHPLEVVFWFWALGYMMDELVGFTEQGSGLYLASFWNTINLGILLILLAHFGLRIYGIVMPDAKRQTMTNVSYELLGADAILIFPRIFSVLDHYRKFSQLIIAFRWMAADAAAVFVLITIACSGFFVALSYSFGYTGTNSAAEAAYVLLQMVMGYTPAAWDRWADYTVLGRIVLVLALILTQFMIVTILITVMTNSFTAVVKNANEEHQFIFAVNTISCVKSHALFAYVAPLNVIQWILIPLKYVLPFRQYVRLNRTVIKITHFPILLTIFVYEKTILQSSVVERTDVVDHRRGARSIIAQHLPKLGRPPSIANFRQDQALEEVFRQPFHTKKQGEDLNSRKKSTTVVNKWMYDMVDTENTPPQEDDHNAVARLEKKRLGERHLSSFSRYRRPSQGPFSVASDPGDLTIHVNSTSRPRSSLARNSTIRSDAVVDLQDDTADGDDEMVVNDNEDEDEDDAMTTDTRGVAVPRRLPIPDHFSIRGSSINKTPMMGSIASESRGSKGRVSPPGLTMRNKPSTSLKNVASAEDGEALARQWQNSAAARPRPMTPVSKQTSSGGGGKKSPKHRQLQRIRPMFASQSNPTFRSTPNLQRMQKQNLTPNARRSGFEMDMVSDIGDNKAIGGGYVGAIPTSFANQMAYTAEEFETMNEEKQEETELFGRLVMARMNSLEEGFREVIYEMRETRRSTVGSRARSPERPAQVRREQRAANREANGKRRENNDGDDSIASSNDRKLSDTSSLAHMSGDEQEGDTHASTNRRGGK